MQFFLAYLAVGILVTCICLAIHAFPEKWTLSTKVKVFVLSMFVWPYMVVKLLTNNEE